MPWRFLRAGCQILARRIDVTVDGLEHLPPRGPTIIAARHYHHLYDGVVLLSTVSRPTHPIVAIDWLSSDIGRKAMGLACGAARWPIVYRTDPREDTRAVDNLDARRALRHAVQDSVTLLRELRVLLIFPEGYPTIDPNPTPKQGPDDWLPFQPGFVRIAVIAERSFGQPVPIIPAGLHYTETGGRWRSTLRFGSAILAGADHAATVAETEAAVKSLSVAPA